MYKNLKEFTSDAQEKKLVLHEAVIKEECLSTDKTREYVLNRAKKSLDAMLNSLEKGNTLDINLPIKEVIEQSQLMMKTPTFLSKDLKEAVYWAMSIVEYSNGMGIICAAPTAGSSGVFPAVLFKAQQMLGKTEEDVLNAFLVGSMIGAIIGNNATLSGSEGGCQAEVGVASAMAASAITYLAGGTPSQVEHSVALSLKNLLGLICDPVAGLVISPCIKRNAIGVMNAFLAAEMALSGVTSIIPADEVIEAMMKVGLSLPRNLKETGTGGIADTPTGRRIKEEIFGKE
ncbi:L-serine ammonia-lyase, iron-sulfur-dependent, subunit alpha [Promethearchaeum syntrophicum]|uniref:L-serine ammonia-lyase, iron-sulfur-dependent, subunit alpha n=1 Tax=Promethearchaeum syntrophicum TaxID=2594042 RepID=A0A5B9D6S9_9ARCH|nr:L-serine ammonia-lyase, iron-sulfur-dependent, subunit alpha [Candidatus Prometheoarchaeum syntrophicum]QEE14752.1 Serine dehydratase alpha chain [Candidatus Prometheoarchaeum syntrophicum]